jgi:hypothetical protein
MPSHIVRLQSVAQLLTPVTFDIAARDIQVYSLYRQFAVPGDDQGPDFVAWTRGVLCGQLYHSIYRAIVTMRIYHYIEADIDREQEV